MIVSWRVAHVPKYGFFSIELKSTKNNLFSISFSFTKNSSLELKFRGVAATILLLEGRIGKEYSLHVEKKLIYLHVTKLQTIKHPLNCSFCMSESFFGIFITISAKLQNNFESNDSILNQFKDSSNKLIQILTNARTKPQVYIDNWEFSLFMQKNHNIRCE